MMSTGVENLDRSIDKANAWLADIDAGFGTSDRHLAYRVLRAWLHCLRDRLSVEVAAHFAAQLPELLRGVFFDGWNPARVPHKYDRAAYVARFAREARVRDSDVGKAAGIVSAVARQHMSAGVVAEAFGLLPADLRELLEPAAGETAAARTSAGPPTGGGADVNARSRDQELTLRPCRSPAEGQDSGPAAVKGAIIMADTPTVQMQTQTRGAVPEGTVDLAVHRVNSLLRTAPEPVLFARVKLIMSADPAVQRPAIAQVNVDLNGRLIRAQAAGETMRAAVEHASDRLRIRLERAARNWEAVRGGRPEPGPGEWRHQSLPAPQLPYFPRPPGERAVARHKSYALARQTPDEAAADAELMDFDFHLFTERSTGEDSVIYRTADGYRLALAHPRNGLLSTVDPSITVSKMPAPRLSVTEAATRLEAAGQSFLFFVNAATGRGNLIYHRYDGNYGLITPAS